MMVLWERQEGETKVAYDAFWIYCTIPEDEKRSYANVSRKVLKSTTLMQRWSIRWNWAERARAYDNYLVDIEIEAIKKQRVGAAKRHARIAISFQSKIINRLKHLKESELTPQDLARWLDIAVKIERQALGEPTELIAQEHTGRDGGPIEVKRDIDISKLSEEELIILEKLLGKAESSEEN